MQCAPKLPRNKPRYLMGVGYGIDMIICVGLGVDMFDCVYPTRTGRYEYTCVVLVVDLDQH